MPSILLKRNFQAGVAPTIEELQRGELAINVVDGKLYTKIGDAASRIVEIGNTNTGSELIIVTDTAINQYRIDYNHPGAEVDKVVINGIILNPSDYSVVLSQGQDPYWSLTLYLDLEINDNIQFMYIY